ncbi:MAG: hypothetical protein HND57_07310 [Planctomycetes bacterium]|nr:hypothetical protein [Planctomycetota bacterium]
MCPQSTSSSPAGSASSKQSYESDIRRSYLPATRQSVTHKFAIGGHEGYLTIGLREDGTPGEVFIKMSKEGSTLSGLLQAFCRAFSLALQYGLPIEAAIERFIDMRFEPMGHTTNPDIPEVKSIIDYTARYLRHHFTDAAEKALAPSGGADSDENGSGGKQGSGSESN